MGKKLSPPKVGGASDYHTICRGPAVASRPVRRCWETAAAHRSNRLHPIALKGAFARRNSAEILGPRSIWGSWNGRRPIGNSPPFAENTDIRPAINQKSARPCLSVVNPNTPYSVNILLSSVPSRLSPMFSPKVLRPIPAGHHRHQAMSESLNFSKLPSIKSRGISKLRLS
jgi:hypothetical protein